MLADTLAHVTPLQSVTERQRLLDHWKRGQVTTPRWSYRRAPVDRRGAAWLTRAEKLAKVSAWRELYESRINELALDLSRIAGGHAAQAGCQYGKARFGVPERMVPTGNDATSERLETLGQVAFVLASGRSRRSAQPTAAKPSRSSRPHRSASTAQRAWTLAELAPRRRLEGPDLPQDNEPSPWRGQGVQGESAHRADAVDLERRLRTLAHRAGLPLQVLRVASLPARAATSLNAICIRESARFAPMELQQIAVHELYGHWRSQLNARRGPPLLALGTAASLEDQEGWAIYCEEAWGCMNQARRQHIALRAWVESLWHQGASFMEAWSRLRDLGACNGPTAVDVLERVYRGGGLGREGIYLSGWLRVRHALRRQPRDAAWVLSRGRVALADAPWLRNTLTAAPPRGRPSRRANNESG